ncbi:hypothetical protein E5206_04060 [Arthrobacter sp. PAMC25564]|uniref:hypothetical protein n=1 Tax=Arthrobacter sp. PAMC25564 TaxID=2565366 RepID=UPI0010A24A5A|nr:hypothetical protein [Arthrobacter sp. PAMC25564]QCB96203.1 hypothetical protein E5206_04060 [Arthrobacter sp. PAMC25564]
MSNGPSPFDFSQYSGTPANSQSPAPADGQFGDAQNRVAPADPFAGFGGSVSTLPHATHDATGSEVVAAPMLWLYIAAAAAALSIGVALTFGQLPAAAISAWFLGGPVAIAAVALFSLKDTRARTFTLYSGSAVAPWMQRLALLASLVAVVVSALHIANWAGRL